MVLIGYMDSLSIYGPKIFYMDSLSLYGLIVDIWTQNRCTDAYRLYGLLIGYMDSILYCYNDVDLFLSLILSFS